MTSLPAAMLHIASTGTAPPLNKDASEEAKSFVKDAVIQLHRSATVRGSFITHF